MKLIRLRLNDFMIFDKVDVDLSNISLTAITGYYVNDRKKSNGSGKSAFLGAIKYALFDECRGRTKDSVIRSGQSKCSVTLDFELRSSNYSVTRVRGESTNEAQLTINGREASKKVTDVNRMIQEHLGLDAELFDLVYYFNQGNQFGFVESAPSTRKAILAKVFKMDHIVRCYDLAKIRLADSKSASDRARGALDAIRNQVASVSTKESLEEKSLDLVEKIGSLSLNREFLVSHIVDIGDSDSFATLMGDDFDRDISSRAVDLERLNADVEVALRSIASLQVSLQQDQSQFEGFSNHIASLNEKVNQLSDINVDQLKAENQKKKSLISTYNSQIGGLNSEIKSFERLISISKYANQPCPTCNQVMPQETGKQLFDDATGKMGKAVEEIKKIKKSIKSVELEIASIDEKIVEAARYSSLRSELEQTKAYQKNLKRKISEYENRLTELSKVRDDLFLKQSALRDQVNFSDIEKSRILITNAKSFLKKSISDCSSRLASIDKQVSLINVEYEKCQLEIKQHNDLISRLSTAEEKFVSANNDVIIYNHLANAFGKSGMQALLLENAVTLIEQFANEILSQMQTRFTISMMTQRSLVSGDTKETLDIIVSDNGKEKDFSEYSGGEQTLINLAIRLSLSRIISSIRGVEMNCLFLDEVLAPLDDVNRVQVVKAISYLSRNFEQVFVISHTTEINSVVDSQVAIERYDNHSTIRITNGRAA